MLWSSYLGVYARAIQRHLSAPTSGKKMFAKLLVLYDSSINKSLFTPFTSAVLHFFSCHKP